MSNLINSTIISKETLLNFENNLVISRSVDWSYNDKFGKGDDQIGSTYSIRRNIMVNAVDNNMAWNASASAVSDTKVTLVIDRTITVPLSFTDGDLTLKIERFSERYVKRSASVLAARLDKAIADAIVNGSVGSAAFAGTAGTPNYAGYTVGTFAAAIDLDLVPKARQVLQDQSCPEDGELYGVISTYANRKLVQLQATLFNPLTNVEGEYKKGLLGEYDGIEISTSQSLVSHTNGTQGTLVVAATGSQGTIANGLSTYADGEIASGWAETATLSVSAMSGTPNVGDVFQGTKYLVNQLTKNVTTLPFQVTVLSVPSTTSVVVGPAPIVSGEYQNISASLGGTTLTLVDATGATGVESLVYHKSAIAVASPELSAPKKSSLDMVELISDSDLDRFKIRFLRGYDMTGFSAAFGSNMPGFISRLDGAYGIKVVNPAWVVRIRHAVA